MKILIADDDPTIRTMFARALSSVGACETVASGDEAMALLSRHRYHALVLDLHMANGDGFQVLDAMRAPGAFNTDTLVCVVSADASSSARLRAFRGRYLPSSMFMTKPVRLQTLTAVVSNALRKRYGRESIPPPPAF